MPVRPSVDDDAIRELIQKLLSAVGPRRTAMLEHLRRVEGIACEQRRFGRLFSEVLERQK